MKLNRLSLLQKMKLFQNLYLDDTFASEFLLQLYKVFKDEHDFFANEYLAYYSEGIRKLDPGFKLHSIQIPKLHKYFIKNRIYKMEDILKQ